MSLFPVASDSAEPRKKVKICANSILLQNSGVMNMELSYLNSYASKLVNSTLP